MDSYELEESVETFRHGISEHVHGNEFELDEDAELEDVLLDIQEEVSNLQNNSDVKVQVIEEGESPVGAMDSVEVTIHRISPETDERVEDEKITIAIFEINEEE